MTVILFNSVDTGPLCKRAVAVIEQNTKRIRSMKMRTNKATPKANIIAICALFCSNAFTHHNYFYTFTGEAQQKMTKTIGGETASLLRDYRIFYMFDCLEPDSARECSGGEYRSLCVILFVAHLGGSMAGVLSTTLQYTDSIISIVYFTQSFLIVFTGFILIVRALHASLRSSMDQRRSLDEPAELQIFILP